jgi:hypothetical protein
MARRRRQFRRARAHVVESGLTEAVARGSRNRGRSRSRDEERMKANSKVLFGGAILGGIGLIGWGAWEAAKWGLAVVAAPETAGASLLLALATP